jgi:hypothetical protein
LIGLVQAGPPNATQDGKKGDGERTEGQHDSKGSFNQHASCRERETGNYPEFPRSSHALALDLTPTKVAGVANWFRQGFYGGLGLALFIGLFLIWFWQPERQVSRHSENFLRTIEKKNWTGVADFIGNDYQDQWGDDRARVLERMREVLRYLRRVRIDASNAAVRIDSQRGYWKAKIIIDGDQGEVMALVKERVNSLARPFEFEWRRQSAKPWDWKLVRVSNASLEIPEGTLF